MYINFTAKYEIKISIHVVSKVTNVNRLTGQCRTRGSDNKQRKDKKMIILASFVSFSKRYDSHLSSFKNNNYTDQQNTTSYD